MADPTNHLTHSPEEIFPEIKPEISFFHEEWAAAPTELEFGCGCKVNVNMGDTVWFIWAEGFKMPLAIERVTIH